MISLPRRRRSSLRTLLLVVAGLAGATSSSAVTAPPTPGAATRADLMAQIDAQLGQPRYAGASWGIAVVSLDSGRTLYAHRADHLMQPASTAKLFTAALALSTLGPGYRFSTRLLADGRIVNGRLNGSLVLQGTGDPTLGTETTSDWATRLALQAVANGVRSVHGDLIADASYFVGPTHGTGWEAGDLQSWFAAPSSALSVQENIVDLAVSPGPSVGRAARLAFDPAESGLPLTGELVTSAAHAPDDLNLYRAPGEDTLHVFGSVAADAPLQHFKLAVPDPALLAGLQLKKALARHGIRVSGALRVLRWPATAAPASSPARVLGEVLSPPLDEILRRGLKRSQNLYLQNVLLAVGARQQVEARRRYASSETLGVAALQQLLAQIGVPSSASRIDEGAGLSRRNLVTPRALARLLVYLAAQPYAATVRAALPVAGVDGTLIGRMRNTAAQNNVQAKTGSMAYVHCLAGYVTSAAGERLAFAIMLNNYVRPDDAADQGNAVDAIAVLLANYRGGD